MLRMLAAARAKLLEFHIPLLRIYERGSEFEFDEIPGFDVKKYACKKHNIILKPVQEESKIGKLDGKVYKKTRYRVL